jgi:hypothetical protein
VPHSPASPTVFDTRRARTLVERLRGLILGRPLATTAAAERRLTRPGALGAFGLDALSSVANGPDEILYILLEEERL